MKKLLTILCLVLLSSYSYSEDLPLYDPYKTFYENGQLQSRGNYKDGKRDGLWEIFDEDGNLTYTKEYINGEVFDDIKVVNNENGQPRKKTYYKNGKVVNEILFFYYENGELEQRGYLKDGRSHGLWEWFHENGELSSRGYFNGKFSSEKKFCFNYTCKSMWELDFNRVVDKEKLHGVSDRVIVFDRNEFTNWRMTYEPEPFTGTSVTYYDGGKIRERRSWRNGIINGLTEEFYENGQLKWSRNYSGCGKGSCFGKYEKDSIIDGLSEEYYENGQLKKRINYKNGKKSGLYEEFLIDGELTKKIRYEIDVGKEGVRETEDDTRGWSWDGKYNERGQPVGEWESFDEDGNLLSRENYQNGERVLLKRYGPWTGVFRNSEGNVVNQRKKGNSLLSNLTFTNGKKTGLEVSRDVNDYLFSKTNYKDGKKHGLFEGFFNGWLKESGNYRNGIKEGLWVEFHDPPPGFLLTSSSVLKSQGNYKNGKKDGPWENYYDILSRFTGEPILFSKGNYEKGKREGFWMRKTYYDGGGGTTEYRCFKNAELVDNSYC